MTAFTEGDTVEFTWGSGSGAGRITDSYTENVTRRVKGTQVARRRRLTAPPT